MSKMQNKVSDLEAAMMRLIKSSERQIVDEKKQRDLEVQSTIEQHNHQLSGNLFFTLAFLASSLNFLNVDWLTFLIILFMIWFLSFPD